MIIPVKMVDNDAALFVGQFDAVTISEFDKKGGCDWMCVGAADKLVDGRNVG